MSCPADLQPYADAYSLERKQRDNEMWMWFGTYGLSAVSVAVEHCLAGRKARSKYIKKPINEQQGKDDSVEDDMRILALLDLIDEAMILLGHHLA